MKISVAPFCGTMLLIVHNGRFQHADRGSANCQDSFRRIDGTRRLGPDRETLGVHSMLGDRLTLHRTKRARADVKRDKGMRQLRQNLRSEMQSCRRRSDRAWHIGEDRLIACRILRFDGTVEIRRKRNFATAIGIEFALERDESLAVPTNFLHVPAHAIEHEGRSDAQFAPRFDQTLPRVRVELFEKKEFDQAVVGVTPRRQHPSVIQDQEIAWSDEVFQIEKSPVCDGFRSSIEHHHAGILTAWERTLRNESGWQIVIVIRQPLTHRLSVAQAFSLRFLFRASRRLR